MATFLRIVGGIGLALCLAVIIFCCYVAFRVERATGATLDRATQGIDATMTRVSEVQVSLKDIIEVVQGLASLTGEEKEFDEQHLAVVERLQDALNKVDRLIVSVNAGLEKSLAIVDIVEGFGVEINRDRISKAIERISELETQVATLTEQFESTVGNLRPGQSLKEMARNEIAARTLAATEKVIVPTQGILNRMDQVAQTAVDELNVVRQGIHRTTRTMTFVVVLLGAWMGLGQWALMRGATGFPLKESSNSAHSNN